ncbi:MAG: FAD-dependent oxidoreductase, partial [Thiomonas sp.]
MRIAIIGSGISGLGAAWALRHRAQVTLFEAGSHFGGHTYTVDVDLPGEEPFAVDTGFLVLNERTYPRLQALFAELGVPLATSDMSFSVQTPLPHGAALEWSGSNLDTVFAQRRNLTRPAFWRMLCDILRFNREATALARRPDAELDPTLTVGAYLQREGYSATFLHWYLLPMTACIWSCPPGQMLDFPLATLVRFC